MGQTVSSSTSSPTTSDPEDVRYTIIIGLPKSNPGGVLQRLLEDKVFNPMPESFFRRKEANEYAKNNPSPPGFGWFHANFPADVGTDENEKQSAWRDVFFSKNQKSVAVYFQRLLPLEMLETPSQNVWNKECIGVDYAAKTENFKQSIAHVVTHMGHFVDRLDSIIVVHPVYFNPGDGRGGHCQLQTTPTWVSVYESFLEKLHSPENGFSTSFVHSGDTGKTGGVSVIDYADWQDRFIHQIGPSTPELEDLRTLEPWVEPLDWMEMMKKKHGPNWEPADIWAVQTGFGIDGLKRRILEAKKERKNG